MKSIHLAWLMLGVLVFGGVPAWAQTGGPSPVPEPARRLTLEALAERLQLLEQQNAELRGEIQSLRGELQDLKPTNPQGGPAALPGEPSAIARIEALEEQVDLHSGRLSEQAQVKVEGAQRVPIRLTGTFLFNAFYNTRHAVNAGVDYPTTARVDAGPPAAAATVHRSVIGMEFQTPEAVFGGSSAGRCSRTSP